MIPEHDVEVATGGRAIGALAAPASKSVTNRLLVLAALADGVSVLRAPLESDDSAVMRRLVEALGARVVDAGGDWHVHGTGGRLRDPGMPLDAGLSGTTMRFGLALATLAPSPATVTGLAPLLARPVAPLVGALSTLGADIADEQGYPPISVGGGGLRGGSVTVDVSRSSQFASALLLVAPYAASDVEVTISGEAATDYIALTIEMMRDWGAVVTETGHGRWRVDAGTRYVARDLTVEYDASAAAHLLGLAAATGGEVTVTNATAGSRQPDAALPQVLAQMGCEVHRDGDALTLRGPQRLERIAVDLAAMPDQVTTVAALAALCEGTSEIHGVGVARTHETDRLAALATELGKLGVEVEESPDALWITGGAARGPARLHTYDDHRLAMSFAAVSARVAGVAIAEPWCVTKTYPRFWADVALLGLDWREVTD